MQEKLIIRKEESCDFDQIRNVIRLAFRDMEESDHTEHRLVERLRQSKAFIPQLSLVATTEEGVPVGHILLTEAHIVSDKQRTLSLAVAPLSVSPEWQRQGIGSALLREAHRRAADLGYGSALLLGHPDYYPRFGYREAIKHGIEFPFDVPSEYCQVIELIPDTLHSVNGIVRYPSDFFE